MERAIQSSLSSLNKTQCSCTQDVLVFAKMLNLLRSDFKIHLASVPLLIAHISKTIVSDIYYTLSHSSNTFLTHTEIPKSLTSQSYAVINLVKCVKFHTKKYPYDILNVCFLMIHGFLSPPCINRRSNIDWRD